MHWADILAAIYKAGTTPSAIARQEDVSPQMVARVIRGIATSHSVAFAIAAKTNIPTQQLWPGKYLTPEAYDRANEQRGGNRGRFKGVTA